MSIPLSIFNWDRPNYVLTCKLSLFGMYVPKFNHRKNILIKSDWTGVERMFYFISIAREREGTVIRSLNYISHNDDPTKSNIYMELINDVRYTDG